MPRTHKNLPRLFLDTGLQAVFAASDELMLEKEQAHYLGTVLRKKAGDEIVLFNGRDGAFLARIETIERKRAGLRLIDKVADQPPPNDLWYGFAPLKSARLDYMVQKATEMGVGTLQPVITEFTQASRVNAERMQKNIIEAAEQCEVLNVPTLSAETKLAPLIAGWEKVHPGRALILADEGAGVADPSSALVPLAGRPLGLLVGPEGGFSEAERTLLLSQPFVTPVSLGPRILRADTAAVAALAVIQSIIGDWR